MTSIGLFIGPLVMDMNGKWLANTLFKVVLRESAVSRESKSWKLNISFVGNVLPGWTARPVSARVS